MFFKMYFFTNQEEKKGFKEKLQVIQDACLQVQEVMDKIASMGERVQKLVSHHSFNILWNRTYDYLV